MKNKITRFLAVILIFCIFFSNAPRARAAETDTLGSLMDTYAANDQTFHLTASSRFYIASASEPSEDLLQTVKLVQRQFAADGYDLKIVWGQPEWAKNGDIIALLDSSADLGEEGYQLSVGTVTVIKSGCVDGLLYGFNMLQKFIRNSGTTLQGFTGQDVPDTVQRAVSLDCGRKYYSKDWICNFIRQMSWMGYNTLQFHFSDDSGFRFDLWDEAYYKGDFQPENDFSWVCGSNYTSWTLSAYQNDPDKGKYLTTAEVIEILETAREYHIDVIPCFDSPSHLDYLTWTFEQNYKNNSGYSFYSTYDQKTYYAKDVNGIINYTNSSGWSTALRWPYYSAVNVKSAQAKAFIFELYTDIAHFFKEYAGSTDFSIGADEVQLNTSNLASGYSYAWGYSDFVAYINELNSLLNSKGYTVRMYNDFLGSTSYNASQYAFADNIEILYWDSPFNPSSKTASNHTEPVSYYVDQGRVLYNCIQTNTYYALRITGSGSDARSVYNRQWTFYHANEEDIYNEWYSADISEHGDYSEDVADVPTANLGGAYFLIWCDYACVSTETEIWEGVYDKTTQNTGEFYSLLNRMWSNTIKMWNWDIQDSVAFADYAAVRNKFGYFPGYSQCTAAPELPEADTDITQEYAADHSALTAALASKISGTIYTEESYAAYEEAYTTAQRLNEDHSATTEAMNAAIAAIEAAKNGLILRDIGLTVKFQALVNGTLVTIMENQEYRVKDGSFRVYIPPVNGYAFQSVEGAEFIPTPSGDGSGFINGTIHNEKTVVLKYTPAPDNARLSYLIRNAESRDSYTTSSWNAYQTALKNAAAFTVGVGTIQKNIDDLVSALETAQRNLVVTSEATKILDIERLASSFCLGKQVALKVTTSPNVRSLTIEGESLTLCVGKVQTLSTGETVKIWLIYFPADETGSFIYTVKAGSATETVSVSVK